MTHDFAKRQIGLKYFSLKPDIFRLKKESNSGSSQVLGQGMSTMFAFHRPMGPTPTKNVTPTN